MSALSQKCCQSTAWSRPHGDEFGNQGVWKSSRMIGQFGSPVDAKLIPPVTPFVWQRVKRSNRLTSNFVACDPPLTGTFRGPSNCHRRHFKSDRWCDPQPDKHTSTSMTVVKIQPNLSEQRMSTYKCGSIPSIFWVCWKLTSNVHIIRMAHSQHLSWIMRGCVETDPPGRRRAA